MIEVTRSLLTETEVSRNLSVLKPMGYETHTVTRGDLVPWLSVLLGTMSLDDKLQQQTLGLITETTSTIIVLQHQVRPRAPCSERHLFRTVDNQAGAQRRRQDLPEGVSFTDPVDGVRG